MGFIMQFYLYEPIWSLPAWRIIRIIQTRTGFKKDVVQILALKLAVESPDKSLDLAFNLDNKKKRIAYSSGCLEPKRVQIVFAASIDEDIIFLDIKAEYVDKIE